MSKLVFAGLLLAMTSLGGCVVYDPYYGGYGPPGAYGGYGGAYVGGTTVYYDSGGGYRHRRRW